MEISRTYFCKDAKTSIPILGEALLADKNQVNLSFSMQKIRLVQFIMNSSSFVPRLKKPRKNPARKRQGETKEPWRRRTTKEYDDGEIDMNFVKRLKEAGFYREYVVKEDLIWDRKTRFYGLNLLVRAALGSNIWNEFCEDIRRATKSLGWKMKRDFLLHFPAEEFDACQQCARDIQSLYDKAVLGPPTEADLKGKCVRLRKLAPKFNGSQRLALTRYHVQLPVWTLAAYFNAPYDVSKSALVFHIAFHLVNIHRKRCESHPPDGPVLECQCVHQ